MSLALTVLEKAVEPSTATMQKFENAMPDDSIIRAFRSGTDQIINEADYKAAKVSLRRPVDIPVLKAESFFVNTVRQINPTPNVVSSARVALNFSTYTFSFIISDDINADNYISKEAEIRQAIFNGIMSSMFNDPAKALEVNLATYLEANKRTSLPTSTVPGVTIGTGAYEMDAQQYIIKAPVVARELKMYGKLMDIGNVGMLARQREIQTYGAGNAQNLDQFNRQFNYYSSFSLPVTAGKLETHFLVPQGMLGLVEWVEGAARRGATPHDGRFTIVQDPFFGFQWGVFITEERADLSATYGTGLERAVTTRYDFALSVAPVSAYSSVAGVTPILKVNLTEA